RPPLAAPARSPRPVPRAAPASGTSRAPPRARRRGSRSRGVSRGSANRLRSRRIPSSSPSFVEKESMPRQEGHDSEVSRLAAPPICQNSQVYRFTAVRRPPFIDSPRLFVVLAQLANVLLPVFAVAGVGYGWRRLGMPFEREF